MDLHPYDTERHNTTHHDNNEHHLLKKWWHALHDNLHIFFEMEA
jgi:hypothetical protein